MSILSLALDVIVLVGLGVTIFYCMRLSRALNAFRAQRQEFNKMIVDLSVNIDKARDAIEGMKNASFESGEDLQKSITSARKLADELSLMNDSGNALANRLEKLAEKSRKISTDESMPDVAPAAVAAAAVEIRPAKKAEKSAFPSFFIKDRDFDDAPASRRNGKAAAKPDALENAGEPEFLSQAERDLYEALQKNKR